MKASLQMEATTSYSKFGRSKFELSAANAKVDVLSEPKRHLNHLSSFVRTGRPDRPIRTEATLQDPIVNL